MKPTGKVNVEKKKVGFGGKEVECYGDHDDVRWRGEKIDKQIRRTVDVVRDKPLKIEGEVFCVLDLKYKPSNPQVRQILKRLEADILAYLNGNHTRLLISTSDSGLQEVILKNCQNTSTVL